MSKPSNLRGALSTAHYVHARRARTLRKRGEELRFWGTDHGHTVWVWFRKRS